MSQTALQPPPPFLSSEPHHHYLSPSIRHILLILGVTVFASIFLCLILRQLNSRCIRRLTPSSATSSSDSRRISTRRVNPEAAPSPSLPLFTFSSIKRGSSTTVVSADCAVCLSKFEASDELRLLPLCCHAFHTDCIDTWLHSNQTCPLCRSLIFASDAEVLTLAAGAATTTNGGSFRLEIGNVSQRNANTTSQHHHTNSADANNRHSYSLGSYDYVVDEESSEVRLSNAEKDDVVLAIAEPEPPVPQSILAAEVGSGRSSWLREYIDRLSSSISSRDISFRSSERFFTGSSRRTEISGEWGLEVNRVGEEISEMFRWVSGV